MRPDPIGNARRKQVRKRMTPHACERCGYADPVAMVDPKERTLEEHHVAGRVNFPALTSWLCRNCHALETERLRDLGVPLDRKSRPHFLQRIYALLRGMATAFEQWANQLHAFAEQIETLVERLNEELPDWQTRLQEQS